MTRIWRLSDARFADYFDGGYGLLYDGRWNRAGRPVTYAATSPSLCLLEKLVHSEDFGGLPPLVLVSYDIPNPTSRKRFDLAELPVDWVQREVTTQSLGEAWLSSCETALLYVPSVIVPVSNGPDENILINHRHPESAAIKVISKKPFRLDARLEARRF